MVVQSHFTGRIFTGFCFAYISAYSRKATAKTILVRVAIENARVDHEYDGANGLECSYINPAT